MKADLATLKLSELVALMEQEPESDDGVYKELRRRHGPIIANAVCVAVMDQRAAAETGGAR